MEEEEATRLVVDAGVAYPGAGAGAGITIGPVHREIIRGSANFYFSTLRCVCLGHCDSIA